VVRPSPGTAAWRYAFTSSHARPSCVCLRVGSSGACQLPGTFSRPLHWDVCWWLLVGPQVGFYVCALLSVSAAWERARCKQGARCCGRRCRSWLSLLGELFPSSAVEAYFYLWQRAFIPALCGLWCSLRVGQQAGTHDLGLDSNARGNLVYKACLMCS